MSLSRRAFLRGSAMLGAVSALVPALAQPGSRQSETSPAGGVHTQSAHGPAVVSFHLDQPYLDLSGRAEPYRPPAGLRGGEALAALTEAQYRSLLWSG